MTVNSIKMNLTNILFQEIKARGHVTIREFMELALTSHPSSYYRAKNPLNEEGDFITSPEVSQMFGEMVGVWIYNQWLLLGCPKQINLVELGAGQGVLMRDILKVLLKTDMKECFSVYLYDVNQVLISKQKENLEFFSDVNWVKNLVELPKLTSIFVANEFFDALPINQYVKVKKEWMQVVIKTTPEQNELIFDNMPIHHDLGSQLNKDYVNANEGAVVERSEIAAGYLKTLALHSKNYGSVSLIIDYGYDIEPVLRKSTQFLQTLQSIKNHTFTHVLKDVGKADLTTHVDFNYLRKLAIDNKVKALGAINQRDFLISLGIEIRLGKLIEANPLLKDVLEAQYNRLVSHKQMGELFKAICISKIQDNQFLFENSK